MQKSSNIKWDHSHDFSIDNKHRESKVKVVFWLTTTIMVLEIGAGTWTGSMALLADGWHMGTHSAAFLITIFAYSYAKKHVNNRGFSFGTGKVNYLGGFASAVTLAVVALMMAIESIQRLIEPHPIHFYEAIIVAIIGLVVNIASVFLLHDDHHHHTDEQSQDQHHEHHHDHNMKAAYFHVLADTFTSFLAIVALLTGKYFGWIWMDAVMGIVGSSVIARWSYGLIKESSSVLLDKNVGLSNFEKLARAIKNKNMGTVTDLHIWKIGTSHQSAIVSVISEHQFETEEYKQLIKEIFPMLSHISIEIRQ